MDRDPSALVRPAPHEPLLRRVVRTQAHVIAGWYRWIGAGRLIVGLVATAATVVVGWWLLAAPTPPVEASLPRANLATSAESTVGGPLPSQSTVVASAVQGSAVVAEVVVHVSGEVARPGIVRLAVGSRVVDAIDAAGGATSSADLGAVNLAAILLDGQKVVVPRPGEVLDPLVSGGAVASGSGPLSLSSATPAQLEELPGVGPVLAAAIVRWREAHGGFVAVDQLDEVPGIGPALLERLRSEVVP